MILGLMVEDAQLPYTYVVFNGQEYMLCIGEIENESDFDIHREGEQIARIVFRYEPNPFRLTL